jgi:uncharacterized protein
VPKRAAIQRHSDQLADRLAEYCFQVPANRIGSYEFSTVQLKTIQEVIALTVFSAFLRVVSGRAVEMELPGRLWIDRAAVFVILKW